VDAYLLLGGIHEQEGDKVKAGEVYSKGLAAEGVPEIHKLRMKARLDALKLALTGSGTK
jgi:hypothetical protein